MTYPFLGLMKIRLVSASDLIVFVLAREARKINQVNSVFWSPKKYMIPRCPTALRFPFSQEFPHAGLAAEVIVCASHPLPHGRSCRDVDLTTGVLNKFFGVGPGVHCFLFCEYFFQEKVKAFKEEEKKEDEEKKPDHD